MKFVFAILSSKRIDFVIDKDARMFGDGSVEACTEWKEREIRVRLLKRIYYIRGDRLDRLDRLNRLNSEIDWIDSSILL